MCMQSQRKKNILLVIDEEENLGTYIVGFKCFQYFSIPDYSFWLSLKIKVSRGKVLKRYGIIFL